MQPSLRALTFQTLLNLLSISLLLSAPAFAAPNTAPKHICALVSSSNGNVLISNVSLSTKKCKGKLVPLAQALVMANTALINQIDELSSIAFEPGPKGDKGDPGEQGIQGIPGIQGATGPAGAPGMDGAPGPIGPQGPQGIQGLKGDKGDTGATGAAGSKGDTGATGPQGLQGNQGPKGDTGATGIQGPKGDKGDIGATGTIGPQGDQGATGPQGVKGDKGDTGATGPQGNPGPQGPAGVSAFDIAYGDGSDGNLVVSGVQLISDIAQSNQFEDIFIPSGTVLQIESGTLIRCRGSFVNQGTISVTPAVTGGTMVWDGESVFSSVNPEEGTSRRGASNGVFSTFNSAKPGQYLPPPAGLEGVGITAGTAKQIYRPPYLGGGGGGATIRGLFPGVGGGAVMILCQGSITSSGKIEANGVLPAPISGPAYGLGGAGGGIVLLASSVLVKVSGLIEARGSAGGDGKYSYVAGNKFESYAIGVGGGGGGGLISFMAPQVITTGAVLNVQGGPAGKPAFAVPSPKTVMVSSGGGGGAMVGSGGRGGSVTYSGNQFLFTGGQAGNNGLIVTKLIDPSALY